MIFGFRSWFLICPELLDLSRIVRFVPNCEICTELYYNILDTCKCSAFCGLVALPTPPPREFKINRLIIFQIDLIRSSVARAWFKHDTTISFRRVEKRDRHHSKASFWPLEMNGGGLSFWPLEMRKRCHLRVTTLPRRIVLTSFWTKTNAPHPAHCNLQGRRSQHSDRARRLPPKGAVSDFLASCFAMEREILYLRQLARAEFRRRVPQVWHEQCTSFSAGVRPFLLVVCTWYDSRMEKFPLPDNINIIW